MAVASELAHPPDPTTAAYAIVRPLPALRKTKLRIINGIAFTSFPDRESTRSMLSCLRDALLPSQWAHLVDALLSSGQALGRARWILWQSWMPACCRWGHGNYLASSQYNVSPTHTFTFRPACLSPRP